LILAPLPSILRQLNRLRAAGYQEEQGVVKLPLAGRVFAHIVALASSVLVPRWAQRVAWIRVGAIVFCLVVWGAVGVACRMLLR
jgi:hypothetical protein